MSCLSLWSLNSRWTTPAEQKMDRTSAHAASTSERRLGPTWPTRPELDIWTRSSRSFVSEALSVISPRQLSPLSASAQDCTRRHALSMLWYAQSVERWNASEICLFDYGGSRRSSMRSSVEPPFLPRIHPESPGNYVSDVPDFKIFPGEHVPGPP